MIPKFDTWGIVLAGHWNRMIFTPEWVGARLFHQDEVETKIALMPVFPIIYRHDQVTLEVSSVKVIFQPRFNTNESLELAESMAITVLDDLPNTPLLGVGLNFSFLEIYPPRDLLEIFNLSDARMIARADWDISETKVMRKLTGEHGTMLLTFGQGADGVSIDMNFHTDTPGDSRAANATAKQVIGGSVVKLRDAALDFLHNTYNLNLEEG